MCLLGRRGFREFAMLEINFYWLLNYSQENLENSENTTNDNCLLKNELKDCYSMSLSCFPSEIIFEILRRCSFQVLGRCSLVCKKWQAMTKLEPLLSQFTYVHKVMKVLNRERIFLYNVKLEIKKLFSGEPTVTRNSLKTWLRLIDTYSIWERIAIANGSHDLFSSITENVQTLEQHLEKSQAFIPWCKNQQFDRTTVWLNLNRIQLTSLPKTLGKFRYLQQIDLGNNYEIKSLPTQIGKLSLLVNLFLNNNRLTSIPTEIGHLSNLQKLNICKNKLTSVPTEIGLLVKLRLLNVKKNQLLALPSEIGNLTILDELDIGHNQLALLPREIGQLTQLSYLNIKDNSFISKQPDVDLLLSQDCSVVRNGWNSKSGCFWSCLTWQEW